MTASAVVAGARAGEVLLDRENFRWVAYLIEGEPYAAVYVAGRLLRRDVQGWWVADYWGKRTPVVGSTNLLEGTAPSGWPIHPEQTELAGGGRHV